MTCGLAIRVPDTNEILLATGSRLTEGTRIWPNVDKIIDLGGGVAAIVAGEWGCIQRVMRAVRESDGDLMPALVEATKDGDDYEVLMARPGGYMLYADSNGFHSPMDGERFVTIGSGSDMATGFLAACRKPQDEDDAARLAKRCLKFVCTKYACEAPPFKTRLV